jgi:nucleoid-associated protein YgaU
MASADFDAPLSVAPSKAMSFLSGALRFCLPGILFFSCTIFLAAVCQAQDVTGTAKQERSRKESRQKKSNHVYTEEDLKRARIVAPEDRAELEAKKNQQTPLAAENSVAAEEAQPLPPDAPLGDVARRFRKQKESEKLRQFAEFHLPFAGAPALASPKAPLQPLLPHLSKPTGPGLAPYHWPVKRSPFARPETFMAAPLSVVPERRSAARLAPLRPVAPMSGTNLRAVTVRRGDSLWKLAQQNLGQGARWHNLLSANPAIVDPNRIQAGSQIYLPAAISSLRTTTRFTVRTGDTLSKIAQTQLGHASYTACIVHANPAIRDANLIYAGQMLLLPAGCTP